jgi:pilus assembly protein CpaF
MVRITVTEKGGPVRRLEFDKGEITVGRVQGNDIILAKGNVSKRHARLTLDNGQWLLEDLNSTNGTYVNGRRIGEPHTIRPADRVFIGDFVIEFAENEVPVTARRGSGDVHPERPVDLDDPLADLSKRRLKQAQRELPVEPEPPPPPPPAPPAPPSRPPRPAPAADPAKISSPALERPPIAPLAADPAPARRSKSATAASLPAVSEPPRPASRAVADMPPAEEPRAPAKAEPARAAPVAQAPRAQAVSGAPSPADYGRLLLAARRRLAERVDLARAGIFGDDLHKRVADAARELVAAGLAEGSIPAAVDTEQLHGDLVAEVVGFGPLEELLDDPDASEILVNDASSIFVERGGRVTRVPRAFSSSEAMLEVLRRLVSKGGAVLPEDEPVFETRLRDGARLIAVLPPFAPKGPSFVLRKSSRQARTLPELVRVGSLSEQMARFLELCIRSRRNVLVAGAAGAGKTALLSAIANTIAADDRTVVVEESSELVLPLHNVVSLEARLSADDGREATMRDLVRAALRIRPEWMVVGDCRGSEAFDLAQSMAGGRDGTILCIHANSVGDALARLEALAAISGEASARGVREAVARGVHIIVQLVRGADGTRRVAHIAEVTGLQGDTADIHDVYLGDGRGHFRGTGYIPRFVDDLTRRGVALDLSIFRE